MRNLKKLLSVLVVVAMLFTLMVPAFAAIDPQSVSEGITDENVKAAVEKLVALGIVNGKEDGKYHPEENITRDAFVKMVVEALGMGSPAQAPTPFSDVPADRWSSGYINAAVGAGLVKGRPDGTFGPLDNVTMAEAVTVLVRALGYQDSFLTGSWPANYMAMAAQTGVSKGVRVGANEALTRGAVAILLDNALDANIVERNTYGDENTWKENKNETLLYNRLGIVKVKECDVIATPKVKKLDDDQITYNTKVVDVDDPASDYDGDNQTIEVAYEYVDINSLLGLNVSLYIDEDTDKVVYVEPSGKNYKVIYDVIDAGEKVSEEEITLVNADDEYEFSDEYTIYLDNEKMSDVDELETYVKNSNEDVVYGKFVLDEKGAIKLADLHRFDGHALIVVDVDEDENEIIYNEDDADDEDVLALEDDYDKFVIYDTQGNVMDIGDIQKDDIIYLNDKNYKADGALKEKSSTDEVAYVVVVRNTVEGVIESYDEDEVEIDGETYDWSTHGVGATISVDDDDTYYIVNSTNGEKKLADATDDEIEVVALLDIVGDVRHVRGTSESSSDDMYSVITGVDKRYNDIYIKVINSENDEVEYLIDADDEDIVGYPSEKYVAEGDLIKYTLNSDGDIDSIAFLGELYAASGTIKVKTDAIDRLPVGSTDSADKRTFSAPTSGDLRVFSGWDGTSSYTALTVTDDFRKDSVEINSKDYVVDDGVVALDVSAAGATDSAIDDLSDAEFVDYASLDDKSGKNAEVLYVLNDDDSVVFIAFLANFDAADDEMAGYAVDARKKNKDYQLDIVLPTGEKVRYVVDDDGGVALGDEMIVVFKVTQNGKIKVLSPGSEWNNGSSADYKTVTGVVYAINGKNVTIADATGAKIGTYKIASDCVVYKGDDSDRTSSLKEKRTLVTVAVKNGLIEVIKIYDVENGTSANDSEARKFYSAYNAEDPNSRNLTSVDQLFSDKDYSSGNSSGKYEYKY